MPLTDTACRNAKPADGDKPIKLSDGLGLHLLVNTTGKYWRLAYRFGGKQKTLALGVYPAVSLKDVRERRDEARKLLASGIDPGEARKAQRAAGSLNAANSFEVIAREWHGKFLPTWTTSHADKIMRRFERDVFPWLGSRPVAEIDAPALLAVLRRIESRGATETAHRTMMQSAGQVFRAMPSLPSGRSATLRLIW